jgi:YfdX protein
MLNRFPLKPIAAALMAGLIAGGPAYAERAIQEDVNVTPGRHITPQDEATISSTAVKVLRHIAAARGALQSEKPDTEKAKVQLNQSEKLLDIIQAALPTTKIKDRIWVAKKHLEYEDSEEVLPDLIPIDTSLEELVDFLPTTKAKAHLDNAKQALKKGDKSKAAEQLQEMDDALFYVEADLPLSSTRHLVDQARSALAKGKVDAKAADRALAEAEDNVVFVSMSFDSPLTQAKAALYRAWQNVDLGEKGMAKTDLNAAVKYLERAAKNTDKVTRDVANSLISDVRDLHNLIETDGKGVSAKVESAWRRANAMTERSAEYISTGWQRFRAEGAGKKDLIESKLQLAFARIDRFNAKDDAAAKVELAEAKGYLDAAVKQVSVKNKPEVQKLMTQMADLEKALSANDADHSHETAFSDAEFRLAALIRQL